ncbi:MAG: transglutaminase-like domain-containing protein [Alphaproteobacteria bacterium]
MTHAENLPPETGRDPRRFLRCLTEQDDGRLPLAHAALAAAKLDPISASSDDRVDEALQQLDSLGASLATRMGPSPPDAATAADCLAGILHMEAGFTGDSDSYDDLRNGNLFRVLERRRGLPVALGIIYMHVGRAAGLTVDGLAFPGHFLVRVETAGSRVVVDPFFDGIQRDAPSLRELLKTMQGAGSELTAGHYDTVPDRDVLFRLQNNIKMRLIDSERLSDAASVVETMVMMRPGEPTLWRDAGILHANAGNLRAAIEAFGHFMDLEPRQNARLQVQALVDDLKNRLN